MEAVKEHQIWDYETWQNVISSDEYNVEGHSIAEEYI